MRSVRTLALLALATAGTAQVQGTLYFTRFNVDQDPFRVKKVDYTYNGTNNLTLAPPVGVAQLPGADGLTFAPDGDLVVGGQGNVVFKLDPTTGAVRCSSNAGTPAYHVTLDPAGQKVWVAGLPGSLAEVPILPACGNGTVHTLTGPDTAITQLMFVGPTVYYTASGPGGNGSFGVLDLTTFMTTRLLNNVPAAHGIALDSFTGHLLLFGAREIWQVQPSPTNPVVVSKADFSSWPQVSGSTFDQGTTDGNGRLFAAVNNGNLVFIDYSRTSVIDITNASNYAQATFLATFLDDIAPLSGLGCASQATWSSYGTGWPGTNGVQALTLSTLPRLGNTVNWLLTNTANAPTQTCIVISASTAANPTPWGGTQLVGPSLLEIPNNLPLAGLTIGTLIPNLPIYCGLQFYAQAYTIDSGASQGISFSPGLSLRIGF